MKIQEKHRHLTPNTPPGYSFNHLCKDIKILKSNCGLPFYRKEKTWKDSAGELYTANYAKSRTWWFSPEHRKAGHLPRWEGNRGGHLTLECYCGIMPSMLRCYRFKMHHWTKFVHFLEKKSLCLNSCGFATRPLRDHVRHSSTLTNSRINFSWCLS